VLVTRNPSQATDVLRQGWVWDYAMLRLLINWVVLTYSWSILWVHECGWWSLKWVHFIWSVHGYTHPGVWWGPARNLHMDPGWKHTRHSLLPGELKPPCYCSLSGHLFMDPFSLHLCVALQHDIPPVYTWQYNKINIFLYRKGSHTMSVRGSARLM